MCCQYMTAKLVFDHVHDIDLSTFSRLIIKKSKKRLEIPTIAVVIIVLLVGNQP